MSSYIVSFLNRQPSRRNEGTQIAFRQLGRSRTPNHKESHGNAINLTKRQSPLAKEANIFKENLSEVLLSDSAIKRWREADFSDDSSPGENDYQNVSSPYDRIVTDSSPLRRSPSPRSRSFCQPVFEDDIDVVKDSLLDNTQKASTRMTTCTRGNSILSQMLNNPISQAQRKKRNDPSVKNPALKRNKSRARGEGVRNKSVKDLKAVQTGFAEEKHALMSRDINSSSYSQRLESAISTSKPLTKNRIADYEVGKLIAKGSYSLVRHGMRKKDKVPVAIKTYDHSKLLDVQKRIGVDREINALKQLDHPHIINMMDSFSSKMQTCIVMEEVGTCTLYKFVKSHADNRLTCKGNSEVDQKPLEYFLSWWMQ